MHHRLVEDADDLQAARNRAHHLRAAGRRDKERAFRAEAFHFRGELRHGAGAEHNGHRHGNIRELVQHGGPIIVQSRSELALIVGAGSGLSASLARKCAAGGMRVALAARHVGKLDSLVAETQARAIACDAADILQVEALFDAIDPPELVVYNPSYRVRGPFLSLDPVEVHKTLMVTAYGGVLVAPAGVEGMRARGPGRRVLARHSRG